MAYKGFSPSQIRYLCIKVLKMDKEKIRRKVHLYVSRDWINKGKIRFFREKVINELRGLGYIE